MKEQQCPLVPAARKGLPNHLCRGDRSLYPILALSVVSPLPPPPHSWRHGVQAGRRWQGQGCGYLELSRTRLSNWETSQSAPGQGELVKFEASRWHPRLTRRGCLRGGSLMRWESEGEDCLPDRARGPSHGGSLGRAKGGV